MPKKPSKKMTDAAEEALELVDEIQSLIEDDVPEWALDKAPDFFDSVSEKAKDIAKSVELAGDATEGQIIALEHMRDGVQKWIKD